MAFKPQAEKTASEAAFAQTNETPADGDAAPGGFGGSSTIILLLVLAGFLWWNMRRRRLFEDRMREQRRVETVEQAQQSAMNVANIMRSSPSRADAAAAASQGLASAASVYPPAPPTFQPDESLTGDEAATLADRAAAEEAERAAYLAERASRESLEVAGAQVAAAQARADTADVPGMRKAMGDADVAAAAMEGAEVRLEDAAVVTEATANESHVPVHPGLDVAVAQNQTPEEALRQGLRELDEEPNVPFGAVVGDGTAICPDGYPIKGNGSSKIYHEPNQTSYTQTVAEFCFASPEAAELAGYRRSKAHEHKAQK
jgi:hypothetical protein